MGRGDSERAARCRTARIHARDERRARLCPSLVELLKHDRRARFRSRYRPDHRGELTLVVDREYVSDSCIDQDPLRDQLVGQGIRDDGPDNPTRFTVSANSLSTLGRTEIVIA
jgi:hypothetical protein